MKLTIKKCDWMDDWWLIERAEHDGRVWEEQVGGNPNHTSLRYSARISDIGDADVEGTTSEMLKVADAIERRDGIEFKRCAVRIEGDRVLFWSPRNSAQFGVCNLQEADELVQLIRRTCSSTTPKDRS